MKRLLGPILAVLLAALFVASATPHRSAAGQKVAVAAGGFDCADVTEIPQSECEALVTFYNATTGNQWHNRSGWLMTTTPCTWFGITCAAGHVTGLNQGYENNLNGALPPELANLTQLKVLSVGGEQLSGVIPPELGTLAQLEGLLLRHNAHTSIPPQLGQLATLRIMRIESTLEPSAPTGSDPRRHEGVSTIPPELGNLANLEELTLRYSVAGPLPPELGNLANLKLLNLSDNQGLSGTIPPELGNLTALEGLDLAFPLWACQLLGPGDLTGPLPAELGNLSNLRSLDLFCQGLTGPMPMTFINLDELTWLNYDAVNPAAIGLCEPRVEAFQEWIAGVTIVLPSPGVLCGGAQWFPMIFKAGAP